MKNTLEVTDSWLYNTEKQNLWPGTKKSENLPIRRAKIIIINYNTNTINKNKIKYILYKENNGITH